MFCPELLTKIGNCQKNRQFESEILDPMKWGEARYSL